ncbi:hypothetical protein GQ43DRAFT_477964 [Delitschia confertaspora ATCC 74209]|uniref:Mediator of RNA polymerase II transcription subunit 18 n=1 Tax=Delitschia confertaspora ATCC 74209 TaxID=1513339 RepID=A0A9P4JSK5_9PLEO|nr:hypothetical protein GQ43DRAFT_477964 [Delitschia confertaspora ATCC 74209]
MYELLLFGQVPRTRHEQLLKILAGVAAMQPQRVLERHVIYKPIREPEEPGSNLKRGANQSVAQQKQTKQTTSKDLYFTRVVQTLNENDFGREVEKPTSSTGDSSDPKWAFHFQDVPDTGDRGVLMRLTFRTDIVGGDACEYMTSLGNNFVSEYYQEGHRFVHGNIVILLHRILQVPGARVVETAPTQSLPDFRTLEPLDPSGGYILQATIRVQDLNNPSILDGGVDELKRFKQSMRGCVELDVPDRLLFDTRVKYKPKNIANVGMVATQAPVR